MNVLPWLGVILLVIVCIAGCTDTPDDPGRGGVIPGSMTTVVEPRITPDLPVSCGRNVCTPDEACCNGFCIDPTRQTCCNEKPCQGACCTVAGTGQCYDPARQECCGSTLCPAGSCCAGRCMPSGQYYCVQVNSSGCYGLPGYLACRWKDGGYQLVRTNVAYGEIDLDVRITPATGDWSQGAEYWIIPALGGGGGQPAQRVREG